MGRKAVYFINTNREYGYVSYHVWDILLEKGYFTEVADFQFDGQDVMKHISIEEDVFYFAPTRKAICLEYEHLLPENE